MKISNSVRTKAIYFYFCCCQVRRQYERIIGKHVCAKRRILQKGIHLLKSYQRIRMGCISKLFICLLVLNIDVSLGFFWGPPDSECSLDRDCHLDKCIKDTFWICSMKGKQLCIITHYSKSQIFVKKFNFY